MTALIIIEARLRRQGAAGGIRSGRSGLIIPIGSVRVSPVKANYILPEYSGTIFNKNNNNLNYIP